MTRDEEIQHLERMIKRLQKFAAQRGGDVAIRSEGFIRSYQAELKALKEAK